MLRCGPTSASSGPRPRFLNLVRGVDPAKEVWLRPVFALRRVIAVESLDGVWTLLRQEYWQPTLTTGFLFRVVESFKFLSWSPSADGVVARSFQLPLLPLFPCIYNHGCISPPVIWAPTLILASFIGAILSSTHLWHFPSGGLALGLGPGCRGRRLLGHGHGSSSTLDLS